MKRGAARRKGYIDHLEELRREIISILAFLALASVLSFLFMSIIMVFLQAPLAGTEITLNYFRPEEKFLVYLKTALLSGIFFTVPFALFRFFAYIGPALKKNEKKFVYPSGILAACMFYGGGFFAYKLIAPAAVFFFTTFAGGDNISPVWGVGAWFDFISLIILGTGAAFTVPAILLILIKTGIIDAAALSRARPYFLIAVLAASGLFSPPDIVSQLMLAVPLYILFELTIAAGKRLR